MRALVRGLLEHGLGSPGRALMAWRTRRRAESLFERRRIAGAAAAIDRAADSTVLGGPFAGTRYPRRFGDIVHAPKLLGSYEREVHAALEALIGRAPRTIVNVGSGDGYYVAGLARRIPAATVHAVDPDPLAQRACAATARLNAVHLRVRPVVRVDAAALERLIGHPEAGLVLCVIDCEGYEDLLLDPSLAPSLARADILVETHDFARPGVTARLQERFAGTHRLERLEVMARRPADYPSLSAVEPSLHLALLDEYRHMPQSWLAMSSRARAV